MRRSGDTALLNAQASKHLKISELLLAEASARRQSGETIEAMELRDEARTRPRAGLSMLADSTGGQKINLAGR
ncbi:MAG TPA: hypothetical protein VF634_05245 [Pyrinomonadaceae bacterium]